MNFKLGDDSNQISEKVCSQVPYCRGGNGSSCRYYCQTTYAIGKNSISRQSCCQLQSEGPIQCTYVLNQTHCSPFTCSRINFAQTQGDCIAAKNTCYLNTNKHPCENKVCQENTTATNDDDCQNFMSGCVTSQLGCIDQNEACSKIHGANSEYCQSVSKGRCIYDSNYQYCLTNSCQAVNFYENIAAIYQNQSNCPKWLPNCFFYKQKCFTIQPCQNYVGDQFSCPTYQSTDGPCVGIDIEANCAPRQCIDAPNTLQTDDQCKLFKPTCVTNGYGCIEKSAWRCRQALTQNVCLSNSCQWVNSCYTVSTCDKYSIYGQSMCNNQTNCFWDNITIVCRQKQCKDLPSTYTTDLQCAQFDKACVTTKVGCITKSTCSTYPFSYCNGATSTDLEGRCIWSSICRPIKCEDMAGTYDSVCDSWLKGCVSNGKSCIRKSTCDQLQQISCIVDSQLNQCLWINGRCQQYSDCTSLIFKTYEQCQAISKFCTTDGNKCVGLSLCQYYNKSSCINGVDGKCAWAEDSQICSLFQNCNNYKGTSLEKCQLYNQSCNFDGFGCIIKSDCSSYKLNNYLCIGGGTNGKCVYDTDKGCRNFSCSDLKVDITTYDGCNKQLSTCTSDGVSCINLNDCGFYNQQQCIQGLKGKCKFDNNICRYESCYDYQGDLNYCRQLKLIIPCISNGTQCVNKGNCSTYTDKTSCLIGGLDGDCYFTTKCALMTSCTDASKDRDSCERQPYCRYYGDQNETHCIPATCQNLQNGNLCFPAQNFNKTQYTVCQLINGTCTASQAEQLDQTSCFLNTAQTYTWNTLNNTCQSCEVLSYLPNLTNQTNQTGTSYQLALMINILYFII